MAQYGMVARSGLELERVLQTVLLEMEKSATGKVI
jgi:hypothetical protein